jgi:magnesium chelatase subunit H
LLKFVPGTVTFGLGWKRIGTGIRGGLQNASSMLQLLVNKCFKTNDDGKVDVKLPPVVITPDVGLLHPQKPNYYWTSRDYLEWRLNELSNDDPLKQAPRVAILLYRKHVITGLRYINDLILQMEQLGLLPIPDIYQWGGSTYHCSGLVNLVQ